MKWIPKILSLLSLYGALTAVILYVEPELLKDVLIPGLYLPFFVLLFVTIWYTLSLILRSMGRSFVYTLTIIAALILTVIRIMHFGLAAALLLTLVIESWYMYRRHEKIHPVNEQ